MIKVIFDKINVDSNFYKNIISKNSNIVQFFSKQKEIPKNVKSIDDINFNKNDLFLFLNDEINILNNFFEILNNEKEAEVIIINKYHKSKNSFHYVPDILHANFGDISVYNNRFLYNDISTMAFRFNTKSELLDVIKDKNKIILKLINLEVNNFKYISNVYLEGKDVPFFDTKKLNSITNHFKFIKSHSMNDSIINPVNHFYLYSLWNYFLGFNIFFNKKKYNEFKILVNDIFTFDYFVFLITTNCFKLEKEFLFFLYLRKFNLIRSLMVYLLSFFRRLKTASPNLYYLFVIPVNLFVYIFRLPFYLFNGFRDALKFFLKKYRGWK